MIPDKVAQAIEAARRAFITLNVQERQLPTVETSQIANQSFVFGSEYGYRQGETIARKALELAGVNPDDYFKLALAQLNIGSTNNLE